MQWKIKQLRVNAEETRLSVTGAFVLSMLKVRRHSAFDANPKRLLAMPCVAAEMLAIILCAPRRSAFFLDAVASR